MLVVETPFKIVSCYRLMLWYHLFSVLRIAFINRKNMHIHKLYLINDNITVVRFVFNCARLA